MNHKPIIIILGEPFSTFSEIIFKFYKSKLIHNYKRPIVYIGSSNLLKLQMSKLKYKIKLNNIKISDINKNSLNNKTINIINVDFKFKNIFDKISTKSFKYIKKCFNIALFLMNNGNAYALINGPISKKHFLKKKYLGITEYLSKKIKLKKSGVMLIYNPNFSVSPITTHLPFKNIYKNISIKKIVDNILEINLFYRKILKKKPNFAVLGLNPHCETVNKHSEEDKIIKPAIKKLISKKVKVKGPFSADTFFSKQNLKEYDVAIGMYHDQVLTPIKTIYKFDAINITVGLPFIRVSPDHGTNNEMIGKNKSNPQSFFSAINFFRKLDEN